jgi:hypothetical protein
MLFESLIDLSVAEFGLNLSDDEISTCIDVMKQKGERGAPHPFFA